MTSINKGLFKNTQRKWSSEEIELLKKLYPIKTSKEIAQMLNRTRDSVKAKIKRLQTLDRQIKTHPAVSNSNQLIAPINYSIIPELDVNLRDELIKKIQQNIFQKNVYKSKHHRKNESEVAVLVLSDIHFGSVNKVYSPKTQKEEITYNNVIRQQELCLLRNSIFQIYDLLSKSYNFSELYVFLLGDIITNDRIFKGQIWEIETPYGIQIWDAVRDLSYLFNELKTHFRKINVVSITGNHGRSLPDVYEEPIENNFEYQLYKILEVVFKNDPQVNMIIPKTRFYSVNILGHSYFLHHGDAMRGTTLNYLVKSAKDLLTSVLVDLPRGYDLYVIGHFHKAHLLDLNESSTLMINGSFIRRDNYSFKIYKQYTKPVQWFFGINKKRSITWHFKLDFDSRTKIKI